jgi:hypothetical protein
MRLNEFNRRERLLQIVRGKISWRYFAVVITLFPLPLFSSNKADFFVLYLPTVFMLTVVGIYMDYTRRINALVELIGEDKLRKTG